MAAAGREAFRQILPQSGAALDDGLPGGAEIPVGILGVLLPALGVPHAAAADPLGGAVVDLRQLLGLDHRILPGQNAVHGPQGLLRRFSGGEGLALFRRSPQTFRGLPCQDSFIETGRSGGYDRPQRQPKQGQEADARIQKEERPHGSAEPRRQGCPGARNPAEDHRSGETAQG